MKNHKISERQSRTKLIFICKNYMGGAVLLSFYGHALWVCAVTLLPDYNINSRVRKTNATVTGLVTWPLGYVKKSTFKTVLTAVTTKKPTTSMTPFFNLSKPPVQKKKGDRCVCVCSKRPNWRNLKTPIWIMAVVLTDFFVRLAASSVIFTRQHSFYYSIFKKKHTRKVNLPNRWSERF